MTQKKTRLRASEQRLAGLQRATSTALRKAETRTKIQLGGLLIKSRLAERLHISPGEDLQVYGEPFSKVATLLGALLEAADCLEEKQEEWELRGRTSLQYAFLTRPRINP